MALVNKTFSDIITFTRASSATYFDSTGVLKTATFNRLLSSQEFDSGAWVKTNASITSTSVTAPDGTATAETLTFTGAGGDQRVTQGGTVTSGATCTFSVWLKGASGQTVNIEIDTTASTVTLTSAWVRYSVTGPVASGVGVCRIISRAGNTATVVDAWGAQLEQASTAGPYYATTNAANGAPRFDYNPATLVAQGFLVEEQRTNTVTQSTAMDVNRLIAVTGGSGSFTDGETINFSGGGSGVYVGYSSSASILALRNATGTLSGTVTGASSGATRTVTTVTAGWDAVVGITRSPAAGTAPDGTVTAVKIEETAVNNEHINRQVVAGLVSGNVYTVSFFAKAAERTCGRIRILDAVVGTAGYVVNFDLVAGTTTNANIGAGTVTSSFCTPVGNGWFRVGVTGSLNQTSALFDIYTLTSISGPATYLGVAGSGYLMWGAQFETSSAAGAAPFATSFVPTTTTALTRSADVASVNTLSPWFNATEGTLFAESVSSVPSATLSGSIQPNIIYVTDGTSANRIGMFYNTGNVISGRIVTAGAGSNPADISANLPSVNRSALAYAIGTNQGAFSVNASAITTSSPTGLPIVSTMSLGAGPVGIALNGYLRRITYYPRRLSNAELQAITA